MILLASLTQAQVPPLLSARGPHALQRPAHATPPRRPGTGATLPRVHAGPVHQVYGYLPYWDADLTTVPWDELSHLALFSADVGTDGQLSNTGRWGQAADAVALAAPYGVHVHLCITNFDTSELEQLLGDPVATANLVSSLASWVADTGAHGISVDFENLPASRRQELVDFVADLALVVPEVTVALPPVDWSGAWDVAALSLDADLFLMGYGYHYAGSANAGPVDTLYGGVGTPWPDLSLERSVADYLADGAAPERLVLGLPLYGRAWNTADASIPAASTGSVGAVFWADAMDAIATHGSTLEPGGRSVMVYDGSAQTWTNDVETLRERLQFARTEGLAGVGFWALNYDDGDAALWAMVASETGDADTDVDTDTDLDTDADTDSDADVPVSALRVGPPVVVEVGRSVGLVAEFAGTPDRVHWTQTSGPSARLEGADTLQLTVTALEPGHAVFTVEVEQGSDTLRGVAHVVGLSAARNRCGCAGPGGRSAPFSVFLALFVALGLRNRRVRPACH